MMYIMQQYISNIWIYISFTFLVATSRGSNKSYNIFFFLLIIGASGSKNVYVGDRHT